MNIKNKQIVTAIAICAVAVAFFVWHGLTMRRLVVFNEDAGQAIVTRGVDDGYTFSVSFIHSVNKSNVEEIYEVRGDEIYLTGCVYRAFGAGVADVLEDGWELSYDDDGNMIISGMDRKMDRLSYIVGTVYDHFLQLPDERINLREQAGRNATVAFNLTNGFGMPVGSAANDSKSGK